jgi:hypothetical protein
MTRSEFGDSNFEAAGISADYLNLITTFDDEMREDGFETTSEDLKAEFNEPLPPRFGFQKTEKQTSSTASSRCAGRTSP